MQVVIVMASPYLRILLALVQNGWNGKVPFPADFKLNCNVCGGDFGVFETRNLTVVTGSTDLSGVWRVADPGSLFRTRCMSCGREAANYQSPICAALQGKG